MLEIFCKHCLMHRFFDYVCSKFDKGSNKITYLAEYQKITMYKSACAKHTIFKNIAIF